MFTITICTDAGHKNLYKESLAVWACYIRTPQKTINVSGMLKNQVKGSSQAELYAIANALHIVARDHDLSKYKLILYSDSLYALRNHRDGSLKKGGSAEFNEVYDKYIRPYLDKPPIYEARHVKAHLPPSEWGANSARHFMQNWCDEEVRRLRKIAEKEVIDRHRKPPTIEK